MEFLKNLIFSIFNSIATAFELLTSFLADFIDFLKLLAKMPGYLVKSFQWIPEELAALILIILGVVIFYKILGREG